MMISNQMLLIFSLIAIIAGPILHHLLLFNRNVFNVADRIIFIIVGGLVVFHLVPHSFEEIGLYAIPFLALGILIPVFIEKGKESFHHKAHKVALIIIFIGIFLHALLDGMALSIPQKHLHEHSIGLPLAVILHRFPVGLTIWILVNQTYGLKAAVLLICVICVSTVAGFFMYNILFSWISMEVAHSIYAIVSGSLFHILYHRPHYTKYQ